MTYSAIKWLEWLDLHQFREISNTYNMPSDMFQVADKYLHRSNYHIRLSEQLYCASFPEKLLLGIVETDNGSDTHQELLKFSVYLVVIFSYSQIA